MENIIYNSIDALKMKEKSRLLKVRITRKSMVISNNGSALLSSELRQVFDPFYTRGKTSGTGLGLAITKNIVNAHRFKIKMENVPGGIATTISFR